LAHQIAPSLSVEDRCNFSIRLAHIVEAHKDYVSGLLNCPGRQHLVLFLDAANGLALCSRWMMKTTSNWKMASFLLSRSKRNFGFLPLKGCGCSVGRRDMMYPKMPFRSSNGYELEMFLLDRSLQMMQALSYWFDGIFRWQSAQQQHSHRRMGRCSWHGAIGRY